MGVCTQLGLHSSVHSFGRRSWWGGERRGAEERRREMGLELLRIGSVGRGKEMGSFLRMAWFQLQELLVLKVAEKEEEGDFDMRVLRVFSL